MAALATVPTTTDLGALTSLFTNLIGTKISGGSTSSTSSGANIQALLDTIANFSPQAVTDRTQAGVDYQTSRLLQGPLLNFINSQNSSGGYGGVNPYLSQLVTDAAGQGAVASNAAVTAGGQIAGQAAGQIANATKTTQASTSNAATTKAPFNLSNLLLGIGGSMLAKKGLDLVGNPFSTDGVQAGVNAASQGGAFSNTLTAGTISDSEAGLTSFATPSISNVDLSSATLGNTTPSATFTATPLVDPLSATPATDSTTGAVASTQPVNDPSSGLTAAPLDNVSLPSLAGAQGAATGQPFAAQASITDASNAPAMDTAGTITDMSNANFGASLGTSSGATTGAGIDAAAGDSIAASAGAAGAEEGGGAEALAALATVLCSEANRQGLLSNKLRYASFNHGHFHYKQEVFDGYHLWAIPMVKLMQKSKLITRALLPLITAYANEAAWRMADDGYTSKLGKFLHFVGPRACGWIGRNLCKKQNFVAKAN